MSANVIKKVYRYRLQPTAEQERQFRQFAGCRRYLYNWGLERKKAYYKATGKTLTYNALAAELTKLKKEPDTAWLAECDSQALQQALKDLELAFANFFKKRARFPKRKKKRKTPHSFRIPQRVNILDSQVSIPKKRLLPA